MMIGKADDDGFKADPNHIVVMGPSGCGKSTIGAALADSLHVAFVDGDDLHSAASVAKMASGHPLTDADRWPWLERVATRLNKSDAVIACSALTSQYRHRILDTCRDAQFVELLVPHAELYRRMSSRNHFMPLELLDSQLATWEHLQDDEPGISLVNDGAIESIVARIRAFLAGRTSGQ